jgi:excisionase family DNA binding protein
MGELVKTKELCKRLKIHSNTVYNWRNSGMPFIQVNKRTFLYDLKEVQKWLKDKKVIK